MDILDIFIASLLMILICIIFKKINTENFESDTIKNTIKNRTIDANASEEEDPLKKTKSVITPIELLTDNAFSDVTFHRSVPIWGEETGLQKCMDNCNGTCVEFGVTGDAMCFPRQ